MNDTATGWLEGALEDLEDRDLARSLRHHDGPAGPWLRLQRPGGSDRRVLHLCGNSYLGLTDHPKVVDAMQRTAASHGTGAGASRLVTGGTVLHRRLERRLAEWKGTGDVQLYSSGYLANLGVVTGLVGDGDTVVSDELNHASIVDACRLSGAQVRVYDHGDADHAAAQLAGAPGRRLLITDGVFSMDGDLAPLPALCDAAEAHGAMVVVDDAHGSGVIGPDGRGTVAALGCEGRVTAIMATLSKALAGVGGYVAGSRRLVRWLRNTARSFIFDTAMPAPSAATAMAALEVVRAEPDRRRRVRRLARELAAGIRGTGAPVPEPDAAVVPVVVGDNRAALRAMEGLLERDVLAVAIRPPSVPPGTARLRATVMATHTDEDIALAVDAFREVL